MCSPVQWAMMAISVVSAASSWQEQRQQAANQSFADYRTKGHADQAYLADLSKIETERGLAAREKALEEFKSKQQRRKDTAKALNLGFGNPFRVQQDVGTAFDEDYQDINYEFEGDMFALNHQRKDAYANMQRIYNNIAPVYSPTGTDLMIRGATGAAQGYAMGAGI